MCAMTGKAVPTGDVFKNNDPSSEYNPKRDQMYFVMKDQNHEFCLGLTDLLECLKFAEEQGEIPKLPGPWWIAVEDHYNIS